MAELMLLRSSGHCGSAWLAELLATQNMTVLFEFAGRCPSKSAASNASLAALFASACACRLDVQMAPVCPHDEGGHLRGASCTKHALCAGRCPRRASRAGCQGVAMISSFQPALAHRLREERRLGGAFAVATFERDNAVKHSLSKLRTHCRGSLLKGNHPKAAADGSRGARNATAAYLHIQPALLRAEAVEAVKGRLLMAKGIEPFVSAGGGGVQFELHYEELQRSLEPTLRQLLQQVGVKAFNQSALSRSAMRKGSSDSLRGFVLNFDELRQSFADQPCLQRMLDATDPVSFPRDCVNISSAGQHHQAKQDAHARILWCATSGVCEVMGMKPWVPNASYKECTSEEKELCRQATSLAKLPQQDVSGIELCTLRAAPIANKEKI